MHYLGAQRGAMYSAEHNLERFYAESVARNRCNTPVKNLYISGKKLSSPCRGASVPLNSARRVKFWCFSSDCRFHSLEIVDMSPKMSSPDAEGFRAVLFHFYSKNEDELPV